MTIRAKRRTGTATRLEEMSDHDLEQIWFFGDVVAEGTKTVTFRATDAEKERAGDILHERRELYRTA